VLGRGDQPTGWIRRDPVIFPGLKRPAKGVLHDVFRQCEILNSEQAGQYRDQSARLVSEQMLFDFHYRFSCITGRISTDPPVSSTGQPEATCAACSRSRASMIE